MIGVDSLGDRCLAGRDSGDDHVNDFSNTSHVADQVAVADADHVYDYDHVRTTLT